MIFNGNPGTGKTTVAGWSPASTGLWVCCRGQLVEVDRSELVAGYLGQTAMKTAEVVKSAEGGVLFIDEAYSLAGDQYGTEAIDTLVKEMEDKRNDLVVIVAGYPLPMAVFIAQNPGLESRFRTTIDFADYTDDGSPRSSRPWRRPRSTTSTSRCGAAARNPRNHHPGTPPSAMLGTCATCWRRRSAAGPGGSGRSRPRRSSSSARSSPRTRGRSNPSSPRTPCRPRTPKPVDLVAPPDRARGEAHAVTKTQRKPRKRTQGARRRIPRRCPPPRRPRRRTRRTPPARAPPRPGPATGSAPTGEEDVPRLPSRWQVVAVLACLLFAVATASLQVMSWHANRAAADNTEQLVRVQNIQSTLFRADARHHGVPHRRPRAA